MFQLKFALLCAFAWFGMCVLIAKKYYFFIYFSSSRSYSGNTKNFTIFFPGNALTIQKIFFWVLQTSYFPLFQCCIRNTISQRFLFFKCNSHQNTIIVYGTKNVCKLIPINHNHVVWLKIVIMYILLTPLTLIHSLKIYQRRRG